MSEKGKIEEEEFYKEVMEIVSKKDDLGQDKDKITKEVFDKMFEYQLRKAIEDGAKKKGKDDWIVYVYCSICFLVVFGAVLVGILSGNL